jgi:hypothetical protein
MTRFFRNQYAESEPLFRLLRMVQTVMVVRITALANGNLFEGELNFNAQVWFAAVEEVHVNYN